MTEQPKPSRWTRRRKWALIVFVLLLPVQYVLSIGPAYAVCDFLDSHTGRSQAELYADAWSTFYWPLDWCGRKYPRFGEWMEWYVLTFFSGP